MSWQLYQLRLRMLSPLHIGWQKIGNIQRTRPYVMSRNLWAAVTARLTRDELYRSGNSHVPDYLAVGNQVRDQIAFTYFFPEDHEGNPLFPHHTKRGLTFGNALGADVFAWCY